ncbi:expressed unknown protein [Seminavis robusta]|uniref:Uncharacterized protein n=1 Tax=Seminavis robusta TaxID=568900 RepID=A0A9N8E8B0_9STRA|nr:expressed unknown protein [Seminavis robusta]|eukprot:Sro655_g182260.1 n/a (342) ;mRNA; r:25510-26535
MGGGYWNLGRIPRDRYLEIEAALRVFLDETFGNENYRIPRYYGAKVDFGDVDILLSSKVTEGSDWDEVKKLIIEGLGIKRHGSISSRVFSIVYHGFQVDFFRESHEHMLTKTNYMGFNDLGNLIGRLFRPLGLKYGERGLFFVFRRKTGNYTKVILVSADWEKILTLVGLDYGAWVRGFHEIEEMFEWIIASPYFRSTPYISRKSKVIRKGAKMRPTIQKFLQYIEERNIRCDQPFYLDEDEGIALIERHFPELRLKQQINDEQKKEKEATVLYAKYNGRLAMEWVPQLGGKSLGDMMSQFTQMYSPEELLMMEPAVVRASFIKLHEEKQPETKWRASKSH